MEESATSTAVELSQGLRILGHFIRYHARKRPFDGVPRSGKAKKARRRSSVARTPDGAKPSSSSSESSGEIRWFIHSDSVKELREKCDFILALYQSLRIVPEVDPPGWRSTLDRAYEAIAELKASASYRWGRDDTDADLPRDRDEFINLLRASDDFVRDLLEKEGVSESEPDQGAVRDAVEYDRRRLRAAMGRPAPLHKGSALRPIELTSYQQYRKACRAKANKLLPDKEAYSWLQENEEELPASFSNWARYVRAARRVYGDQKHQQK